MTFAESGCFGSATDRLRVAWTWTALLRGMRQVKLSIYGRKED